MQPDEIRFSIVVPTLYREVWMNLFVNQMEAQTHTNWEMRILHGPPWVGWQGEDPRIVLENVAWMSASKSRQHGRQQARANILWCPSDDNFYHPRLLERVAAVYALDPEEDIVKAIYRDHVGRDHGPEHTYESATFERRINATGKRVARCVGGEVMVWAGRANEGGVSVKGGQA